MEWRRGGTKGLRNDAGKGSGEELLKRRTLVG